MTLNKEHDLGIANDDALLLDDLMFKPFHISKKNLHNCPNFEADRTNHLHNNAIIINGETPPTYKKQY